MEVHFPKEFSSLEREINRALGEITTKFKESEELPLIASIRKPAPHQQNKRVLSVQRLMVNNRKRLVVEDQGQLYYVDLTPVNLIVDPNSEGDTVATASYVTATASASLPNDRVLTQTSNQVIVTDNGAGSTIVLSLPQDYHTAATPQLARLGLGNAADGTASLKTAGAAIIGGDLDHDGGNVGFYNITPVARPSAITQTYNTADRTLGAYTADDESSAYTGIDNAQAGTVYAQVADLNALRTAYETLRAFVEDGIQLLNSVVDDLQANGLEQ